MFLCDNSNNYILFVKVDKNGTLNFDEFQNLLETIAKWKVLKYNILIYTERCDWLVLSFSTLSYRLSPSSNVKCLKN